MIHIDPCLIIYCQQFVEVEFYFTVVFTNLQFNTIEKTDGNRGKSQMYANTNKAHYMSQYQRSDGL